MRAPTPAELQELRAVEGVLNQDDIEARVQACLDRNKKLLGRSTVDGLDDQNDIVARKAKAPQL